MAVINTLPSSKHCLIDLIAFIIFVFLIIRVINASKIGWIAG